MVNLLLITISALTIFVGKCVHAESICPQDKGSISPCTCEISFDMGFVKCPTMPVNRLENVLAYLSKNKYQINVVTLNNSNVVTVSSNFFGSVEYNSIALMFKNLQKVEPAAFQGQENSLDNLEIWEAQISEFPIKAINTLKKLLKLKITGSKTLEDIKGDTFLNQSNPHSIKVLDLSFNGIRSIENQAFKSLMKLESLTLEGNYLQELSADIFPSGIITTWKIIDLSHNNIIKYPGGVLKKLIKHANIYLSSNNISFVSELDLGFAMEQKFDVQLDGNHIFCHCGFKIFPEEIHSQGYVNVYGKCTTPVKLSGTSFDDLKIEDFKNC